MLYVVTTKLGLYGCRTLSEVAAIRSAFGWDLTSSRPAGTLERADWRLCRGVAQ